MTLTLTKLTGKSSNMPIVTTDAIRRRALERLYQRKAAVDELIDSLENYQRCRETQQAAPIPLSVMPRCS